MQLSVPAPQMDSGRASGSAPPLAPYAVKPLGLVRAEAKAKAAQRLSRITPSATETELKGYTHLHFEMLELEQRCYKDRSDPASRRRFIAVATEHLQEMPEFLRALNQLAQLRRKRLGLAPGANDVWAGVIPTYGDLELVLCEDGDFEGAVDVWRSAVSAGYASADAVELAERRVEKRRARMSAKTR